MRDGILLFDMGNRRRHAEGGKNPIVEKRGERLSGHACHDHAEEDVAGVGVLEFRAGREIERVLACEETEHVIIVDLYRLRIGNQVFVVPETGGVIQQIPDGDGLRGGGQLGQDLAHRLIVAQPAVMLEQHDRHRGELLGEGREPVIRFRRRRGAVREIGHAEGAAQQDAIVADHQDARAGDEAAVVGEEIVDRGHIPPAAGPAGGARGEQRQTGHTEKPHAFAA